MKPFMKAFWKPLLFCALGTCAPWTPILADDLEQNLIARWTFKDGSLVSDVGDFQFQEGGRGMAEPGDGTITLNDRKFLVCPEISSALHPDLRGSVTLWVRVKFDELPKERELGVMSLQADTSAGGWNSLIFSLLYRPMKDDAELAGMAFLARPQNAQELGVGAQRFQRVTTGEFLNVAIVFNGQTGTAGMWVSSTGQFVDSKQANAGELQDFQALILGKFFDPGAETAITFDEVRVYSTALDPQWLEEITPVKDRE